MKKKILLILSSFVLIFVLLISNLGITYAKDTNIDEVLKSKEYSSLSIIVKKFIKEYYEEKGVILLTKELAKDGQAYLNPSYIKYLDSEDKSGYYVIPSITAYKPVLKTTNTKSRGGAKSPQTLPSSFDLRNVNGKVFVTPNKNQGNEGLCWAYATVSLLETHDLIAKNKSYDSTATLFSEKQLDYALSFDGIIGGNKVTETYRGLTEGGYLDEPAKLIAKGLTAFQDTWNTENYSAISNKEKLAPYIVFDRSKSLYEADETIFLAEINYDLSNPEEIEATVNMLKNIVYNNGGAVVSIKSSASNLIRNINGDYLAITNENYFTMDSGLHALHLIGWDDDYEYTFCSGDHGGEDGKFVSGNAYDNPNHECGTWYSTATGTHDYVKVTGRGAWILKNSWGSSYSYLYLPYDSGINDLLAISTYSEKNWDSSIPLENDYEYSDEIIRFKFLAGSNLVDNDSIVKLKFSITEPVTIPLYYSESGNENDIILLGNYEFDSAGIKTIDLSDKNLHINSNSYFQIEDYFIYDMMELFIERSNNNIMGSTEDYSFSMEYEKPSNTPYLSIDVTTELRNVTDKESLNYKIKYANGSYLPTSAYSFSNNKAYYDMATPIIQINEQYAKKGEYTLETWKDNTLLCTSKITLDADYVKIEGSGTNNDPWQIKTVRHFNMMSNEEGNYRLMNDLDFEYDTQNENGLFYNSGSGWQPITFSGNFDGNNKTIRNIKAEIGLFYDYTAYGDCKYDKCGIHDLNVDNISIYKIEQYTGGIINSIDIINTYGSDFSNLSLTNGHLYADVSNYSYSENPHFYVGGIVGRIDIFGGGSGLTYTVMKNDNWYSDFEYNVGTTIDMTRGYIGGLVGGIYTNGMPYASFNNAKTNMNVNINYGNSTYYFLSDGIGFVESLDANININNIIGNSNINKASEIRTYRNAFISQIGEFVNGKIEINGSKSTLDYSSLNRVAITNYEAGLKPYELARANYSDIVYYESQHFVYNENNDGTTKVRFSDRFNIYDNMIPTLKSHPETYSTYYKTYSMNVGETKSIDDLISNDTGHRKLKVYSSYNCNLDVCNNVTDQSIIRVPTELNGYKIEGLKSGTTTLILYDELSGYLDKVEITVINNSKYTVTFDSGGGSSVASQTVTHNNKATKPTNPTKDGYTFKEWQLNGQTYDFNTPVTSNITLTATWTEIVDTLKDILEDSGYNVASNFVSKFKIGDTIAAIKSKLGNNVTVETSQTIISTGAVIKKGNESYTVVIKGDLTGEGKVNSGDLLQMRKYLLEEVNLTGAYKEAGIIESVGNIKSLDLLRLRQYLLGEYEFK